MQLEVAQFSSITFIIIAWLEIISSIQYGCFLWS